MIAKMVAALWRAMKLLLSNKAYLVFLLYTSVIMAAIGFHNSAVFRYMEFNFRIPIYQVSFMAGRFSIMVMYICKRQNAQL